MAFAAALAILLAIESWADPDAGWAPPLPALRAWKLPANRALSSDGCGISRGIAEAGTERTGCDRLRPAAARQGLC